MRTERFLGGLFLVAAVTACGGRSNMPAPQVLPQSISPALIKAAPMAKTAALPRSAMSSPISTKGDIQGVSWTQIPGSASQVSASTDGSIWVLSTQPSGPDKYIWHYVNGAWSNISGLASQLAIAPNGTLYAINSGGGTYSYSNGSWTALGGGASALTAAADGSTYVLSNGGSGPDRAIWHNVSGTWSQVPGSGTTLAASWDTSAYSGTYGSVNAGGLYILNSVGSIYYENPGGTFASFPGNGSAVAASTTGGMFVLGYPASASGNTIYYFDLNASAWKPESGAGVSIASDGAHLYVVGASGGIYSSPIVATATPPPSNIPQTALVGAGSAFVTSTGYTLYQFTADGFNVSNCTLATYSGCSGIWPPYIASAGATASGDFATFTRGDGRVQWSFQGHPLYTYSGDSAPYQSNGNGIRETDGTSWSVSRPPSSSPTPDPTPPPCYNAYC